MTANAFRLFLVHPKTGPQLDLMLADNVRIDAALADVVPCLDVVIAPVPETAHGPVVEITLEPQPLTVTYDGRQTVTLTSEAAIRLFIAGRIATLDGAA